MRTQHYTASSLDGFIAATVKPGSAEPGPWPYPQPTWVFSSRALPLTAPPIRRHRRSPGFAELRYEVPKRRPA